MSSPAPALGPAATLARKAVKRLLGGAVAALSPQCRFSQAVFLFGHMRCGSTALSRVLSSHPEISGSGEAHVAYCNRAALGQLLLGQCRRGAWKRDARYLHDKLLHNRYDAALPPGFAQARAIFLVRPPEPTIRSIRHLFRTIDSPEYATDSLAADYYAQRVRHLARLWRAFPAQHRIGLDFAELMGDPEAVLARLTRFLGLSGPLANAYAPSGPGRHGLGDPLTSPRFAAITSAAATSRPADKGLALPPGRMDELERLHGAFTALICPPVLRPGAAPAGASPAQLSKEISHDGFYSAPSGRWTEIRL